MLSGVAVLIPRKQPLLAGLALMVGFAFVYATRERDPVYKGRRLSEYLREVHGIGLGWGGMEQIEPGIVPDPPRPGNMEASEAVLSVGTNALPMLVRLLGTRESRAKPWLRQLAGKYPVFKRLLRPGSDTVFQRNMSALLAFHRLGPRAAAVVPRIIPMLEDPDSAPFAAVALMYIRPQREPDILSLTNALHVRKPPRWGAPAESLHCMAMLALSTFGTNASGAIPLLMQALGSTNGEVAAASAVVLARIGGPRDRVVPVILENLPKSDAPPRAEMISMTSPSARRQRVMNYRNIIKYLFALSEYGRHASHALPRILALESYPNADIQRAAREAAAKIKGDTNSVPR
jgi:hypothetical protein